MKDQLWFDGMISQIKDKLNEPVIVVEDKPKAVVINIQERIRAKADDCIARRIIINSAWICFYSI